MARHKLRHGTTAQVEAYTGPAGEIVVSSEGYFPRLQDGTKAGGHSIDGAVYAVQAPSMISPLDGAGHVSIQPSLQTSPFSGNGAHIASYWEVATDTGFNNIIHASGRTTTQLTSYSLANAGVTLTHATQYYVRVRHESDLSLISEWGTASSFETKSVIPSQLADTISERDGLSASQFAYAVAISGDASVVAVGTSGGAYVDVFTFNNGSWSFAERLLPSSGQAGSLFGRHVEISDDGDVIAVSAYLTDVNGNSNAGVVEVFRRLNGSWSVSQELTAQTIAANDYNGRDIALSGNGLVLAVSIGLGGSGNGAGKVQTYRFISGVWQPIAALYDPNARNNGNFGVSLAISYDGTRIAVSNYYVVSNSDRSKVYIFDESPTDTWLVSHTFDPGDASAKTSSAIDYGTELDLSADGKIIAIGADSEYRDGTTVYCGGVYVFEDVAGNWTSRGLLSPSDGGNGDVFGRRLAISGNGDYIVIGASLNDNGAGNNAGAAYLFSRANEIYSQVNKFIPSSAGADNELGFSVDIGADGSAIAVGAKAVTGFVNIYD